MPEINIKNSYITDLKNILKVLEQHNNASNSMNKEEIKITINKHIKYFEMKPDLHLTMRLNDLESTKLIDSLFTLYQNLKSIETEISSISKLLLKYIMKLQPRIIIEKSSVHLTLVCETDIQDFMGYIFDITPSYIVVGYKKGLALLDKKTFAINKKIAIDFYCYHYYKHPALDKIILYYAQEIQFLVLVDLITEEQKIISLHEIGKLRLSEIHTWHNNTCIIATYDEIDVAIDIDKVSMKIVKKTPQKIATYFENLFSLKKEFDAHTVDAIHDYIIFENTASGTYNITSSNRDVISMPIVVKSPCPREEMHHNFYYEHGIFIAISEYEIQIVKNQKIYIVLKPDFPCIFYDARFLDAQMNQLGILISHYYYKSAILLVFQVE